MIREEWHELLGVLPATPMQIGAIHGQFRRLGFGKRDRDRRLAVCAELLGRDRLDSMKELRRGEAGRLLKLLPTIRDRTELDSPTSPVIEPTPACSGLMAALIDAMVVCRAGISLRFISYDWVRDDNGTGHVRSTWMRRSRASQ